MGRILVVDDESLIRTLVVEVGSDLGHEVFTAANIRDGLALARQNMDVILLDVLLPDGDGMAKLKGFLHLPGNPDVIVITGYANADAAEVALRSGVWEYLTKPLRTRELSQVLSQVMTWRLSKGKNAPALLPHPDIIGISQVLNDALEQLREAASSNVNVLIQGETGVGKELFARALHTNSSRSSAPFVTVDCTTLPEPLVEAHLFGYARGAFTGADRARAGLLSAADTGTLFLDEVGDLPLPVQGAFLRALELRCFRPVGEVREVCSDFRIVAATNRNLDDMVRMNLFRSDLRYRLRGMTIVVPPLRQRVEDIPLLAKHFVQEFCQRHKLPCKEIDSSCLDILTVYTWPGNVRELIHALERACTAVGNGEKIFARHLPTEIRIDLARKRIQPVLDTQQKQTLENPTAEKSLSLNSVKNDSESVPESIFLHPQGELLQFREVRTKVETAYLQTLLQSYPDVRKAAKIAHLSRGHLYELLHKYGLAKSDAELG